METMKRALDAEEHIDMERKERDRKGKALAKKETMEEIYEIYDDSDDEEAQYEQGGRGREFSGFARGRDSQFFNEGQQEQGEEMGRMRSGLRKDRGEGNRTESGSRRGRGGRGGRGGRQGTRGRGRGRIGRPAKRTRRSLEKRIHHAERAYNENTNPRIRRIIENMEEELMQAQSDSKMEDWEYLLHDPGNTRGRMSLFK